jgi:hypothetical protein
MWTWAFVTLSAAALTATLSALATYRILGAREARAETSAGETRRKLRAVADAAVLEAEQRREVADILRRREERLA